MNPTPLPFSGDFERNMLSLFGEQGADWLRRLPAIVADCARRWVLSVAPPFAPLSYNYAAPAVRANGEQVVLKIGYPDGGLLREMAALDFYAGRGVARLLAHDPEQGAMLLERAVPGRMLSDVADDAQATSIAAEVMRRLWRPIAPDAPFPTVRDWARGLERQRARFDGGPGPLPRRLFEQAETLCADLLASMAPPVLLHGDLHHFNILSAERQPWLAIDPKGVIGEPAYEVGALLRNPTPDIARAPNLRQIEDRRLGQLAEELGFDRARLRDWGIAQAVLSACWAIEDHDAGWEPEIAIAEALAAIPD